MEQESLVWGALAACEGQAGLARVRPFARGGCGPAADAETETIAPFPLTEPFTQYNSTLTL